jgi:hypothetical protein
MKVKASATPKTAAPRAPAKKAKTEAPAETSKAWKAESNGAAASKKKLSTIATDSAVTVMAQHEGPVKTPEETAKHPLLARFGEHLGLGLGVIVTEGLALLPKWNKPVLDANGKPVASVPGAERIGNHDILARHQEVVGPKITAFVEKMKPGLVHDVLAGLGKGATEAPGASYRLESKIADMFRKG